MQFREVQKQQMEKIIEKEVREHHIAGANVLVAHRGEKVYENSFGMADIEAGIPMEENTIFRMFSMSKVVTSAAAMIAFERGIIDLYQPVYEYLEGFRDQEVWTPEGNVKVERPVLLRDLLNMTSGLTYPEPNPGTPAATTVLFADVLKEQKAGKPVSTVDFANRMGQLPLKFQPGSHWYYGTGADVMGAVLEVATGMRYGEFLQKEIFEPLGMSDTGFYVPEEKQYRFAQIYRERVVRATGESILVPNREHHLGMEGYDHAPSFESGGAGLVSTIEDYRRFAQMLLHEGKTEEGETILGKETVRFMRTSQVSPEMVEEAKWESLRGYGYGNFCRVLQDPALASSNVPAGEFGWDGWLGTFVSMDPTNDLLFLYFIQRCDTGTTEVTRRLRHIVYGNL